MDTLGQLLINYFKKVFMIKEKKINALIVFFFFFSLKLCQNFPKMSC